MPHSGSAFVGEGGERAVTSPARTVALAEQPATTPAPAMFEALEADYRQRDPMLPSVHKRALLRPLSRLPPLPGPAQAA